GGALPPSLELVHAPSATAIAATTTANDLRVGDGIVVRLPAKRRRVDGDGRVGADPWADRRRAVVNWAGTYSDGRRRACRLARRGDRPIEADGARRAGCPHERRLVGLVHRRVGGALARGRPRRRRRVGPARRLHAPGGPVRGRPVGDGV